MLRKLLYYAIPVTFLALSGCKMYGDSADHLGIHAAQVSEIGFVGTWASASDTLTIGGDGSFGESNCGTRGAIEYTSRHDACDAGATCGSSTFDTKSSAGWYGCRQLGRDICTFALTRDERSQILTLVCSTGKTVYRRVSN